MRVRPELTFMWKRADSLTLLRAFVTVLFACASEYLTCDNLSAAAIRFAEDAPGRR
jgi:hypothetical protein